MTVVQQPLFPDGELPAPPTLRPDDPTKRATFYCDASELKEKDWWAVLGRLEQVTEVLKDSNGNLRIRTSRTGPRQGYFRFPADKCRIVPRKERG